MLAEHLKKLLGTTYVVYTKAAGFHWNVEGADFPQYHELLGELYADYYSSIDKIAEYVRVLDVYAPGSLARMLELSCIHEQPKIPRAQLMIAELRADLEVYNTLLIEVLKAAQECGQEGIANFMAERQDATGKWIWQLRSIAKKDRA